MQKECVYAGVGGGVVVWVGGEVGVVALLVGVVVEVYD